MTIADGLEELTDELYRRVGRNLINFQRIEGMLKFLMAHGRLSGTVSELPALRERQIAATHKSTMGMLAGRFLDEMLSDAGEQSVPPDITEAWISLGFRIETNAAFSLEFRGWLEELVIERNDLVHHFQSRWHMNSIESTLALVTELDEQRERFRPIFEELRGMVQCLSHGRKDLAEFLATPEAQHSLELHWLQNSPVVCLLARYAALMGREDGAVLLSSAGHALWRDAHAHVAVLNERYGHKTLKSLILAAQLFDVFDEPTAGGFRTLYRIKPEVVASGRFSALPPEEGSPDSSAIN